MNKTETNPPQVTRYTLVFRGMLDEELLREYCLPGFILTSEANHFVLSNLQLDQAGLLGLIRQLHNLGCTVLSVNLHLEMDDENE